MGFTWVLSHGVAPRGTCNGQVLLIQLWFWPPAGASGKITRWKVKVNSNGLIASTLHPWRFPASYRSAGTASRIGRRLWVVQRSFQKKGPGGWV